jgi:hypothetical protein
MTASGGLSVTTRQPGRSDHQVHRISFTFPLHRRARLVVSAIAWAPRVRMPIMLTMEEALRLQSDQSFKRRPDRQRHRHRSPTQGSPRRHRLQERRRRSPPPSSRHRGVKVGDEVDVLIEKLEDKDGMVVLSKEKAEFKKNWDKILTICNEGGTIRARSRPWSRAGCSSTSASKRSCPRPRWTSSPPRTSRVTWATPTTSRSSRSTRTARTSSCPAAN